MIARFGISSFVTGPKRALRRDTSKLQLEAPARFESLSHLTPILNYHVPKQTMASTDDHRML